MLTYDKYKNYQDYLSIQIRRHELTTDRTVSRQQIRFNDIERIKSNLPEVKKILCVGCRHEIEVKDFIDAGFDAIGIDILSNTSSYIITCDMHDILNHWKENDFDLIYMSHSLEHSYNPIELLKDIMVISKYGIYLVLPIQDKPDEKDPTVFNFMHSNANAFEEEIEESFKQLGLSFSVNNVIYRNACNANEMSFIINGL